MPLTSGDNPRTMNAELTHPLPTPDRPLPDAALRMSQAGLVPFILGAALVWLVDERAHPYTTLALSAFAALMVSFTGGILWGIGFVHPAAPPRLFVWGVVPSLLAWVAVLMPPHAGLALHGVLLVVCYLVDRRVYPVQGAAHWLTLRFRLSSVAALSCFLAAAGS